MNDLDHADDLGTEDLNRAAETDAQEAHFPAPEGPEGKVGNGHDPEGAGADGANGQSPPDPDPGREPYGPPTLDAFIADLAALRKRDEFAYDLIEQATAKRLKVTVTALKKKVKQAQEDLERKARIEVEEAEEARLRAAAERLNTNEGVSQEWLDAFQRRLDNPPPPETETPPEIGPQPDPSPKRKGKGKPPANLLAMLKVVEARPHWKGAVRWNEFAETMEVCEPWPPTATRTRMRPIEETFDKIECMLWLQANGFPGATKNNAFDLMLRLALANAYHPILDYFAKLPAWDGVPRIDGLFRKYFNAEVPEAMPGDPDTVTERDHRIAYLDHVSRCFMVSAVARIHQPGCKVDHLPVLVGDELFGKSKAIAALCPDPSWFSDDVPIDLGSKDAKESLVAKWIIELPEIPHQSRDVEKVKAYISRRTDRYRVPYEKLATDRDRACVFIGTSNDLELISVTGNRRFWPVEVTGVINIAAIERERDQFWAEALAAFKAGDQWWLEPPIEAIASERQQAHEEHDPWQDDLAAWIASRTDAAGRSDADLPFTLSDVMFGAGLLRGLLDLKAVDPRDIARAKQCLKRLRWRPKQFRFNRMKGRYWVRLGTKWG
jgi:Virulence-associated protein E-like domain